MSLICDIKLAHDGHIWLDKPHVFMGPICNDKHKKTQSTKDAKNNLHEH